MEITESYIDIGYKLLNELEEKCADSSLTAASTLKKLIEDNKSTEYGCKYGFASIRSASDYKEKVPFTTYDDYEGYILRIIKGEDNILTVYPLSFFALTTGSVCVSKKIPVSDRAAKLNVLYGLFLDRTAYDRYAKTLGKSGYVGKKIVYIATANETKTDNNVSVTNVSGNVCILQRDSIVKALAGPPETIYGDDSEDKKYLRALYALKERDVSYMRAPFMAAIYDFFCYIEKNWIQLCRDIEEGVLDKNRKLSENLRTRLNLELRPDPERAGQLREIFEQGFDKPIATKIWKDLQFINAIGVGSFAKYTKMVRRFTGELPLSFSIYASSEGLFATVIKPESADYVIIPDSGYYEFIPEKYMFLPDDELRLRTLDLDQLVVGEKYEMVVTNLSGFYRYRIGDVVQVTGYHGSAPTIRFSYRKSQIINVVGEKTSEELFQYAVNELEKEMGINVAEWGVYEDHSISPGRYVVFLETDPEVKGKDREKSRDILEKKLAKANDFYRHYIKNGQLSPMKVVFVMPQTYMLYREVMAYKGASINQMKPVHIIDNPCKEKFFFGLLDD